MWTIAKNISIHKSYLFFSLNTLVNYRRKSIKVAANCFLHFPAVILQRINKLSTDVIISVSDKSPLFNRYGHLYVLIGYHRNDRTVRKRPRLF